MDDSLLDANRDEDNDDDARLLAHLAAVVFTQDGSDRVNGKDSVAVGAHRRVAHRPFRHDTAAGWLFIVAEGPRVRILVWLVVQPETGGTTPSLAWFLDRLPPVVTRLPVNRMLRSIGVAALVASFGATTAEVHVDPYDGRLTGVVPSSPFGEHLLELRVVVRPLTSPRGGASPRGDDIPGYRRG